MSCEHLVCAACAGPVVEGRCPVCRASRERVHHEHGFPVVPVIAVLCAIAGILIILNQLITGF